MSDYQDTTPAARAGLEYLDFMETAAEMALRGEAPRDPDQPRLPTDAGNTALRAFILAKALHSPDVSRSPDAIKLEQDITRIPAFVVVRSIYHKRLGRRTDNESAANVGHVRQKKGFDAFLLAQLLCEDDALQRSLPLLDPELFVPHLWEGMNMADQHITSRAVRMASLKRLDFNCARALAFGLRSEFHTDIRFANEATRIERDASKWPPHVQAELREYTEGCDTAVFMTNACLKAIAASRS